MSKKHDKNLKNKKYWAAREAINKELSFWNQRNVGANLPICNSWNDAIIRKKGKKNKKKVSQADNWRYRVQRLWWLQTELYENN